MGICQRRSSSVREARTRGESFSVVRRSQLAKCRAGLRNRRAVAETSSPMAVSASIAIPRGELLGSPSFGLGYVHPGSKLRPGRCGIEPLRSIHYVRWHPVRERRQYVSVRPRWRVFLTNRSQRVPAHLICKAHQGRPKAALNKGDLACDETKTEHVRRIVDGSERMEDLGSLLMAPPTAADRLASNGFSDVGHWPPRCGQHDAVFNHKADGVKRHLYFAPLSGCSISTRTAPGPWRYAERTPHDRSVGSSSDSAPRSIKRR